MLVQQRIQQDFDTAADVASTPENFGASKK